VFLFLILTDKYSSRRNYKVLRIVNWNMHWSRQRFSGCDEMEHPMCSAKSSIVCLSVLLILMTCDLELQLPSTRYKSPCGCNES